MSTKNTETDLSRAIFNPQSVALIGASGNIAKNTARPMRFMQKHGCQTKIYPINKTQNEVLGHKAYASIADVNEPIDHAFVMVPKAHVAEQIELCAQADVKVMTIYSDGFAESGPEGMVLQNELVAKARQHGIRLIGPNSIGLANLNTGMILSVNAVFEAESLISGPLSLVSQSGSMMGSLLARAAARGFGFSKSISVGNESDLSVGEIVDVLVDDPDTRCILLFLETIRHAPVLSKALERAREAGKPVIAYKLGRSEQGDALAQSHTGALAGNDQAVDVFLRAHHVMRVHNLETLFELTPLAIGYSRPTVIKERSARVAVITTTGGGAATVVDNLGLYGVQAVAPTAAFVESMAQQGLKIQESAVIDLTLAATSEQYKMLLEALLRADWCDGVLSVVGSSAQFHPELAVKPLIECDKPNDKPMVAFLAPDAMESLALLQKAGIAAFRTPESCADALSVFFKTEPKYEAQTQLEFVWPRGLPVTGNLTEQQACTVFSALGVRVAPSTIVNPDQLTHNIPYPVVAKASSPDLLHKTQAKAVKVNISNDEELATAAAEIVTNVKAYMPEARIDGILVQQMESGLLELILGYRLDPLVGPTVLLGAGGIAAELHRDVTLRLAPVTLEQAHDMIREVKSTQLVRGYRGLPKGDCDALAQSIVAFSQLALIQSPKVSEAEINPLFVKRDGVVAVDGLIVLDA
ncbi:acetate--CoA ligase family protein [Orrella sp. 11846]|uniref:acetate--CoA ligase family protein n=1 Tax=Orrella sp. 11846 TaxID=3409913 RepID=UPI003B5A98E3